MSNLALKAPLSGFLMPIEQVPDPVFAEKLLGDGIALDPLSNQLLAPCNGRIIQLHEARHALTIATPEGVEVLLHIGVNTVTLNGEGFTTAVKVGDRVRTGRKLIEFDPDYIACNAPSLLTTIVVTNSSGIMDFGKSSGEVLAGETVIMDLTLRTGGGPTPLASMSGEGVASPTLTLNSANGLHARPAAELAATARKYDAVIRLLKDEQSANAKSIIGMMNLNVAANDEVSFIAYGSDAHEAIAALSTAVQNGLGDFGTVEYAAPPPLDDLLTGVTAAPGLAVGNIHHLHRDDIVADEDGCGDPRVERAALDHALATTAAEIDALQTRWRAAGDLPAAALLHVQEDLLYDPDLLALVQDGIDLNQSAATAWQTAIESQALRLEKMSAADIAARAGDLREAGRRVLRHLPGVQSIPPAVPANSILIAEDLSAADIAALDRSRVIGLATILGGASSDAAMRANALDIPAVAAIDTRVWELTDGTPVILNATAGIMQLNPRKEEIAYAVGMLRKRKQKRIVDRDAAMDPAITLDGRALEVTATCDSATAVDQALLHGASGVGLLRTEQLFAGRTNTPSEAEQAETYAAIAGSLGSKSPLIIRTFHTPISSPDTMSGANFLDRRGIRADLDHPRRLRTQIRAILRASFAGGNIHILIPMIATLDEWRRAKALVDEEVAHLGLDPLPVGIMVNVPAPALMAERFAREVDFFNIDANDLAQYALAMNRNNPRMAAHVDGLNPAILRLVAQTTVGAQKHDRWVAVSGGLAYDAQAVPILSGLGVRQFSVPVPMIPNVKALIRSISFADARKRARYALTLDSAASVRALYPLQDYER